MAEEQPSLHIDTDWKKQAQEEKRRLAEEEQKRAAASKPPERESVGVPPSASAAEPGPSGAAGPGASASASAPRGRAGAGARGSVPEANFATLVQSLATQVLFYLGDLAPRGSEPQVNLDLARYNVELLNILEQKTRNNLSDEEQRLLDGALYETRMRFVSVASQYATV
jgi:hypothetical protein